MQERPVVTNQIINNSVPVQNIVPVDNNAQPIPEAMPMKAKSSLWNRIKNSRFITAIKYAFKIKLTLQLPEGQADNNNNNF